MIDMLILLVKLTAGITALIFAVAIWFYLFTKAMDFLFDRVRGLMLFVLAVPTFVGFALILLLGMAMLLGI